MKLAAIVTVYRKYSMLRHIVDRMLEGMAGTGYDHKTHRR
jgi:hypothetical protein